MKINEVTKQFNISEYTLRYYEKEGLISNVKRINGIRDYTDKDINRINFIVCMRNAGVSIEALKEYIKLYEEGNGTEEKRRSILISERELLIKRINDMNTALEKLNYKITNYDDLLKKGKF
ncbi:MAG: MerR family transcriptional regulator [Anaeroplasmataceae bacterium]